MIACVKPGSLPSSSCHSPFFCIEAVAEYLNWDPRDVYALLADKTNLLDDYIARYFDVLHTQDRLYIAEDIVRELEAEGALA